MTLLLFCSILANAIIKSCFITLTIHISYSAISAGFRHWRRISVAENLVQILKLFQQCNILWSSFQKKLFPTCLEKWLEQWNHCISSDWKYFEKEWLIFCCKYISWFFAVNIFLDFLFLYSRFLWNALCNLIFCECLRSRCCALQKWKNYRI